MGENRKNIEGKLILSLSVSLSYQQGAHPQDMTVAIVPVREAARDAGNQAETLQPIHMTFP